MSTRYIPLLDGIQAALAGLFPDRIVTRRFDLFENRAEADLQKGIYTVIWGGVGPYPYEASDNGAPSNELRATENGRVRVRIIGQIQLAVDADGVAIDAAEAAMLDELEQLADAAIEDELLAALLLKSATNSQQIECPFGWLVTEWEVFPIN